ncbi:hypothetical protein DFJ74DRAFT_648610 [Hyaloraphidium curvatum]|nr:hypothetical protein DFJ74DRAFT_648610 [Hyaloraphidium curvatum]
MPLAQLERRLAGEKGEKRAADVGRWHPATPAPFLTLPLKCPFIFLFGFMWCSVPPCFVGPDVAAAAAAAGTGAPRVGCGPAHVRPRPGRQHRVAQGGVGARLPGHCARCRGRGRQRGEGERGAGAEGGRGADPGRLAGAEAGAGPLGHEAARRGVLQDHRQEPPRWDLQLLSGSSELTGPRSARPHGHSCPLPRPPLPRPPPLLHQLPPAPLPHAQADLPAEGESQVPDLPDRRALRRRTPNRGALAVRGGGGGGRQPV